MTQIPPTTFSLVNTLGAKKPLTSFVRNGGREGEGKKEAVESFTIGRFFHPRKPAGFLINL